MKQIPFFKYFSWSLIPFKKTIAVFLIFLLIVSQTIRVDFFGTAEASADRYRDIISIVVDRKTHRALGREIEQYANNIQNRLGSTRVVISEIDENTNPAYIAAYNEKLYYEGDGSRGYKTQLVGTILIGNVPIPMVSADGKYFPSIFPYVDFENKAFVYNEKSDRYEKMNSLASDMEAAEIWHGVINDGLGIGGEVDIEKLRNFFQKTNAYYAGNENFPIDSAEPKVLYSDGFAEQASTDKRSAFQYELFMKNLDNFSYNRFSKYLLTDINNALKEYDKWKNTDIIDAVRKMNIEGLDEDSIASDTLSDDLIKNTPDVQTAPILRGITKEFHQIFNKKVLGEELAAVHNAGRYNRSGNVNADLVPVMVSLADEEARQVLHKANETLKENFEKYLREQNVARKIAILDSMTAHYGDGSSIPYANYFFGTKGKDIQNASQCMIMRGSAVDTPDFGRGILVEANSTFDVNSTEAHMSVLQQDAPRCLNGNPSLDTFWWGNSLLHLASKQDVIQGVDNPLIIPNAPKFTGFTRPIVSFAGMNETTRLSEPTIAQCMNYDYQYTLMEPHKWNEYGGTFFSRGYGTRHHPTNNSRGDVFLCDSQVRIIGDNQRISAIYPTGFAYHQYADILDEHIALRPDANVVKEIKKYQDQTRCLNGQVTFDGREIAKSNQTCHTRETISTGWGGRDGGGGSETITINETAYRSLHYHLIDGILRHQSPNNEEFAEAEKTGVTPSLGIDAEHFVEFVTRKGNIAKIYYPNYFTQTTTEVASESDDKFSLRKQWKKVLEMENNTNISVEELDIIDRAFGVQSLPNDLSWEQFAPADMVSAVKEAKNWLSHDVASKYKHALETLAGGSADDASLFSGADAGFSGMPGKKRASGLYEIAYFGLNPVIPSNDGDAYNSQNDAFADIRGDYASRLSAIRGLNITETTDTNSAPSNSAQCGPVDGVELFKWPGAVKCWIQSQLPPKISAGQCGGHTIGSDFTKNKPQKNISQISDAEAQKRELSADGVRAIVHLDKKYTTYHDVLGFSASIQDNSHNFVLPNGSTARLEILSATTDGKAVSPEDFSKYFSADTSEIPVTGTRTNFILSARDKNISINARVVYSIPLSDGTKIEKISENFSIIIGSAFLDAVISTGNSENISYITADNNEKKFLKIFRKNNLADTGVAEKNFSIKIFDDITNEEKISAEKINEKYELPDAIVKNIGVYRAVIVGEDGVAGETTFAVRPGELTKIGLNPASSIVVRGADTLMTLSLTDALNNPAPTDLYSVELTAENGSLLDASGNPVKTLNLDIFDSYLTFVVRATDDNLKIKAKVVNSSPTGNKEYTTEWEIAVIPSANVVLEYDGNKEFRIGEAPRSIRIKILDQNGNLLDRFSSAVNISLPETAGVFSEEIVRIRGGQSEIFAYTPWSVAGKYNFTFNIPGIGIISNIPIEIKSGAPMYIDSRQSENEIIFTTRDRYGNIANYTGEGRYSRGNADLDQILRFENGEAKIARENGTFVVEIPEIANNSIYIDASGNTLSPDNPLLADSERAKNLSDQKIFQILPVTKYVVTINDGKTNVKFGRTHNALYTVLAGGSFLKESRDILYEQDFSTTLSEWKVSKSLAVTTLLDSPIAKNTLLSVFPGGWYALGYSDEVVMEASIDIEQNIPLLRVVDSVGKTQIAKISYQMENAGLSVCEHLNDCISEKNSQNIALKMLVSPDLGYSAVANSGKIFLKNSSQNILQISTDGRIENGHNTTIRLKNANASLGGLVLEILHNGGVVAEVVYHFAENQNILVTDDVFAGGIAHVSPVMETSGYRVEYFSDKVFNGRSFGVSLVQDLNYELFDETKTAPSRITDIGTLKENAGAGWMDNNRMMLSFAAGDSVGEATKWFHTYMMVNLWDPVASVSVKNQNAQQDGLDRSIGMQIADSRKSQIQNFFERDMNNDALKDVIVQYVDGYIELFLNLGERFRSAGKIAYIPRLRGDLLQIGDFQWDGFSDIIWVKEDGSLTLLSNDGRKFSLADIAIAWGNIPVHIQQMKVYDMDADKKDDLVYLTSGGQLGILYGTAVSKTFEIKILDETLGLTLNQNEDRHGGAIKNNFIEQVTRIIGVPASNNTSENLTDDTIKAQVYYQRQIADMRETSQTPITSTGANNLINNLTSLSWSLVMNPQSADNTTNTTPLKLETFVRSQYAEVARANIFKKYFANNNSTLLLPDDSIRVEITIQNTSSEAMKNIVYLDSIAKIFARDNSSEYTIEVGGQKISKNFVEPDMGEYQLQFEIDEISANSEAKLIYTLKVLPASYGEMLVGDFEKWTEGHDNYGDIAFQVGNTCGAEKMLWLSHDEILREYQDGKLPATYSAPLPNGLADKIQDSDGDGIPDSVKNMSPNDAKNALEEKNSSKILEAEKTGKWSYRLGFNSQFEQNIEQKAQEIADGLSCGFGGGSCMSFPINWAPLAPGNDPVVMGSPVGDGLKVDEWLPFFSALTAVNIPTSGGCYQVPTVWPASPIKFQGSCTPQTSAGGYLGTSAPTNFVRLFATPTLTLGMGGAVCLGPANIAGKVPPKWLSPLVQWGNCIVMAKAMPICKGDGSKEDGDISGISGLWISDQNRRYSTTDVWNGKSCNLQMETHTKLTEQEKELEKWILDYMRSPDGAKIAGLTIKITQKPVSSLQGGPLINIGNRSGDPDFEVSVNGIDSVADIGKVLDVNNKRIEAFPDFIMNWLTRQTEELTNSLFTPPNLTIIPPTNFGQNAQVDSSYKNFLEELKNSYSAESFANMRAEMATAYRQTDVTGSVNSALTRGGDSRLGGAYENLINNAMGSTGASSVVNSVGGGINAMKSAYTFLGKLPFLNIRQVDVNINVPWILPAELDQYERKLKEYQREVENALKNWCASGESEECLKAKARLQSLGFYSSIQQNLKRIEEYRRFPEKLQKYVTWKEKLLYELLCNIQALEKMTFGWVKDNGVRFQKWAELYVLIKAIAESWQPLVDIFAKTNASCGVCRNERHNSQKWKFKLISAIIPQIPVISFPKWPDVILDLSDVRLGVDISLPNFNFRLSPVKLPSLPNLSLPNSPSASFSLPTLPVLPALPNLPDLPELPSLPTVKLPDLPPPPKLPKIGGSIKASLDILKLISKLYCYYQKTSLIPEWQVGDVIAQRTERQSSLPMDFIDVQFPQFSMPELKEIRISTHLNYTLRTDFITEFAKNAVKPINEWSTNLSQSVPSKIDALEKAADSIENGANNLADGVRDGVQKVQDGANNIKNDIQNKSDAIDNKFDQIENNLQNKSDAIEDGVQDAVNDTFKASSYNNIEDVTNLLAPIIAQLESEKDIFLDTDEFAKYFKSELIAAGFTRDAALLDDKMRAAKIEAEKLQKELEDFNREKFDLLYKFIDEQEEQNAKLQNLIDMMKTQDSSLLAGGVGQLASSENFSKNSSLALSQLENLQNKNIWKNFSKNISAYEIGKSLTDRTKRLAQLTQTTFNAGGAQFTTPSISYSNGYMPRFEGMYVLTETQNIQTKLFDYVEPIQKNDRVDAVDMDNDGDKEYIFVLGGTLYIKKTYLQNPPKIIDNTIKVQELPKKLPEVVNNFGQVFSTPSELNISFENTIPNETEWRMEFYDKYLEWDYATLDNDVYNNSPRAIVDMMLSTDFQKLQNHDNIRYKPVARYIESGHNDKNFVLEWPKIEKLENSIFASISPNRMIYTGKDAVNISYRTSQDATIRALRLSPHTAYQFEDTTEIKAESGIIYIIGGGSANHKYFAKDNLEWLPLLPGMRMMSENTLMVRDATHGNTIDIPKNSHYIVHSLGFKSDRYNVSIPYRNDYYYARLKHLSLGQSDRSGVELISPHIGSDETPPVIDLSEVIRVPVYAKVSFPISDIVTELSRFDIALDVDTSVDDDKNSVYDDDFVKNSASVNIDNDSIVFGAFNEPWKREMLLRVRDEHWNVTYHSLLVDVFTPIPNLENISSEKNLSGILDTAVADEPVDFFRIRSSELPLNFNKDSVKTDTEWKFLSESYRSGEEIVISSHGDKWLVSETGVFKNLPNHLKTQVVPATHTEPMHILVTQWDGGEVYRQFISLSRTARVVDSAVGEGNLVITPSTPYHFVSAGNNDMKIPGGAYITDANHDAILVVARDGNIYILDNSISLTLGEKDGFILISAFKWGQKIADFHYQMKFFYTTK